MGARRSAQRGRRSDGTLWWQGLSTEALLDVRLNALGVRIDGSPLEGRIGQLARELERAGLRFRPRVWLGDDWFSPNGTDGFAVPFFLAHPRLRRLERQMMLEVEGGSPTDCMKLLRHETGHAIDNAYRLHRKKLWQKTFGLFSTPYRDAYIPRPTSHDYVHNLDHWYAQSHPSEDFAETFAVWVDPRSQWRERYAGWPALRKLEVVDALMREIADAKPPVTSRKQPDSLGRQRETLRAYYEHKRAYYREDLPEAGEGEYDEPLQRLFSDAAHSPRGERAERFLARHRAELRTRVHSVTAQHSYLVDQVLGELIRRSRVLDLRRRADESERETRVGAAILLTSLTMAFLSQPHAEYQR